MVEGWLIGRAWEALFVAQMLSGVAAWSWLLLGGLLAYLLNGGPARRRWWRVVRAGAWAILAGLALIACGTWIAAGSLDHPGLVVHLRGFGLNPLVLTAVGGAAWVWCAALQERLCCGPPLPAGPG